MGKEPKSERPTTYVERRNQAEKKYDKRYNRFKTHNFLDWGVLTEVIERDRTKLTVPPYCWRFDEYLGFWLSGVSPIEVPGVLERNFPNPDSLDLDYLNDVLDELEKVSAWKKEPYTAYKGSTVCFGPFLSHDYEANIARAKKWVETTKAQLARRDVSAHEAVTTPITPSYKSKKLDKLENKSEWDGLFLSGFTVDKLTNMLISLGLLTEDRKHVKEIRPRHWRAVIEALRDNKSLVYTDAPRLHKALNKEFPDGSGHLPQIRTLQDAFDPKNSDIKTFQERASAWLRAN